jgi:glycerol-3-phosphate O-acyltransferase/dihydroxyacetone phosphate acyltransferase
VTSPNQRRRLLRLTAKSTQFGKRTFTSWLIECAGTVPIKRRKDFGEDENVDNSQVMDYMMQVCPHSDHSEFIYGMTSKLQALEMGDAVCVFPEGFSRYHPTIAPLKTGGKPSSILL